MHSGGFCEVWTLHEWNCGEHDFGVCKCPLGEDFGNRRCGSLLDVFFLGLLSNELIVDTSGGVLFDVQVTESNIICMCINIRTHTHIDDQFLSTSRLIQALARHP